jgi:TPR repeat protein
MKIRLAAAAICLQISLFASATHADFRQGLEFFQAGNHAQAALSWQEDAEAGEAASQRNLGLLYLNGLGVPKNPVEAARWFKAAADQSFAPAAANLADLYLRGTGVAVDRAKAAEYMRVAAEGGLAESQYNLAIFYEHGIGVEKDEDAAVFWYRRAAGQDFRKAGERLAVLRPGEASKTVAETTAADEKTEVSEPVRRTAHAGTDDGLIDRLIPLFSVAE